MAWPEPDRIKTALDVSLHAKLDEYVNELVELDTAQPASPDDAWWIPAAAFVLALDPDTIEKAALEMADMSQSATRAIIEHVAALMLGDVKVDA